MNSTRYRKNHDKVSLKYPLSVLPSFQYLLHLKWPENDKALAPLFSKRQPIYIRDIIMLITILHSVKVPQF